MVQRETEAGYRELFEESPQAMWVCQRETGRLLAVNAAALRLYGYRREEFLDLALDRLVPAECGLEVLSPSDQVVDCRLRGREGSEFAARLTARPCPFRGEPAQLVLISEVPEETALERDKRSRLEAAQRELEAFSYSVSHDLRAPLRHIDGFSRALMDDYAQVLDGQAQEYLGRICQAAGKMAQLIDSMLQLSRVGRAQVELQEVDLSVKAQVILLELKHRDPERRAEFAVEEGVKARADQKLARQLLEILIGNAWKFTSRTECARIRFGTGERDGKRFYFVSDNGAGFDMAYADKLFTVFHRLHRADEFEGSGVGLAIAQRIVARHDGSIWAESAPGAGATFYFTLSNGN